MLGTGSGRAVEHCLSHEDAACCRCLKQYRAPRTLREPHEVVHHRISLERRLEIEPTEATTVFSHHGVPPTRKPPSQTRQAPLM